MSPAKRVARSPGGPGIAQGRQGRERQRGLARNGDAAWVGLGTGVRFRSPDIRGSQKQSLEVHG